MKEIQAKLSALWILFWASRYFIITDTGKSVSCSQDKSADDIIWGFVRMMKKAKGE